MAAPLALVGLGSSILGGITSAQGALASGKAQMEQSYYQAGIAQLNAKIAKQNADYALNAGEQEAMRRGLTGAQVKGQAVAAEASGNIDVRSGSAAAVQKGIDFATAADTATIRANAAKAAWNYDAKATDFMMQAGLYQLAGADAAKAGQIKAESSLLGTVGSVASKWSQGSQVGLLGDVGSSISSGLSSFGSAVGGIFG